MDAKRGDKESSKKEEGSRYCIHCLLQELDPKRFDRDIRRILDKMEPGEKTDEREYKRRLSICRSCNYLYQGTCNACGCFVELRAAGKRSHCTYRKW